ncbi:MULTISPECIES: hypothetical protein [unclassified Caballeronia]|uniref:hypothetical protein n=1 Tax=unclassified Caballeronia TaxID=2646786 RepID=UPI0020294E9E|nr:MULTISPECIES: hypothetical protein [unclassified Caballeronia]
MNRTEYEQALAQLVGAAELVVSGMPEDQKMSAFQSLAFFRLRQHRLIETTTPLISNDELFKDSAMAALTMAGRKEFLAAAALLEQARSLMSN